MEVSLGSGYWVRCALVWGRGFVVCREDFIGISVSRCGPSWIQKVAESGIAAPRGYCITVIRAIRIL